MEAWEEGRAEEGAECFEGQRWGGEGRRGEGEMTVNGGSKLM